MNAFKKVINPGLVEVYGTSPKPMFCRIEYSTDGRLSITGVVGPKHNGNAYGSCGQCQDELLTIKVNGDGWTQEKIKHLFSVWERWHLNDMRPNCEHQVGGEWEYRDVEYTKITLSYKSRHKLEQIIEREFDGFDLHKLSGIIRALHAAQQQETRDAANALIEAYEAGLCEYGGVWDGFVSPENIPTLNEFLKTGEYVIEPKVERKGNGWMYPKEHPAGILAKPCPVCGYKYGSAWKKEEVPQDVLEFLISLPDTTIKPTWC